ncbi:hypothetical protein DB346_23220 [Verrucomicrobia bacterium LW23]|nr:hypothetical protein DB346_23220 [Verrucomicrobia bacterium LW23]
MIRPYRVGRQEDPANPGVLHDEHTVYRTETTPSWNMLPSEDADAPAETSVGKSTEVTTSTEKLAAELRAKIEQQNQLLAATTEQNERLAAEIEKFQAFSTNRAPSSPPSTPSVPSTNPPPTLDPIPAPPSPAKSAPTPEPAPAPAPTPPSTNGPPRPWYQWWK